MSWCHETNPHFGGPQIEDQHSQLPSAGVVTPQPIPRGPDQQNQPHVSWSSQPQPHSELGPRFTQPHDQDRLPRSPAPRAQRPKRSDRRNQPLGPSIVIPDSQGQRVQLPQPQGEHSGPQKQQRQPPQGSQPKHPRPQSVEHHQNDRHTSHGPRVPSPRRTKLITWFLAGVCAIFWVVVILGGIIILIVYLVFRPHNPRFDVSSVTLNAAYLDVGVLLNADLTVLANFTNPNKKVKVDFSYVVLDLYYGKTLIASQYVEPFSAARATSWLTNVHMLTSQVQLPSAEAERLKKEINNNAVTFQLKGVFRARSNLGSFLRYSYGLYSQCTIIMTSPPSGITRASKCKTKR